jgi:hypothetical protein
LEFLAVLIGIEQNAVLEKKRNGVAGSGYTQYQMGLVEVLNQSEKIQYGEHDQTRSRFL